MDDLLVGRLPLTLVHLQGLVEFYQRERKSDELIYLQEKLVRKISEEGMTLGDRIKLWGIIVEKAEGERLKNYIDY